MCPLLRWFPLLAVPLGFSSCATVHPRPADLIFLGGRIHTLQGDPALVSALAVRDGRILALGSDAEILALADPSTQRVDLAGRPLYPGFTDAHLHLLGIGTALENVDLVGTHSYAEVVARVRARAAERPGSDWLLGRGWDQNDWADSRFPRHDLLSAAFPQRPVALSRIDGHALLANAAAMRAAGVDTTTPDPPGGRILRDDHGRPTGVFLDTAEELIRRVIPDPDETVLRRRIELAIRDLHRHGITAAHDAGVNTRLLHLYQRMAAGGDFDLRCAVMLDGSDEATLAEWLPRGPIPDLDGRGRISVRMVKIYADGALGSRGAALLADYSDDPGNRGLLVTPPERLEALCERALAVGFQPCIHAIGDRGNRVALDALETALRAVPRSDARPRIEHAQVLAPEDLPRFASLGVIPSMQPQHQVSDMPWAEARLGPTRIRGAYAWRALVDSGCRIPFGSDAPVEILDPIAVFRAAISRQDAHGSPPGGWFPEQRLLRAQALRGLTTWAAWSGFEEERLGVLRPGLPADLVVLSGELMDLPVLELDRQEVVLTVFDGRIVYSADPEQDRR